MNAKYPVIMQLNFVGKIKKELRRQKLTQQELADRTGLAYSTISRMMNGHHTPTIENCMRIATAMGLSPEIVLHKQPKKRT
jgi:transcriptional regulator with XRE-family HTH domain